MSTLASSTTIRIEVMNELRQFLPLLLALSASSPFWVGEMTGLKSYRTAVNDATPRKGIPEHLAGWRDYQRAVSVLVRAGALEDGSKVWWDLRPSARFQTLEVRIMDVCPLVDDAVCIAALVRCLSRCLYRLGRDKPGSPTYPLLLINENRWRAQRYGMERGLIDLSSGRTIAIDTAIDDLLDLVHDDAEHFDCVHEVEHARTIAARGTSADRQVAIYHQHRRDGLSHEEALARVVDHLIEETASASALSAREARMAQPSLQEASP